MADPHSSKTPAPPAFQFYPAAFEAGTSGMTLIQVGAYIRLLNYQWEHGSVPGDTLITLSVILRCPLTVAKTVWAALSVKFVKHADNYWQNHRLELERQKQASRRAALAENGKKGASLRWQTDSQAIHDAIPNAIARLSQNDGLSSLSLSSSLEKNKNNNSSSGPRAFDRTHANHIAGFCLFKCLSDEKVSEFAKDLPGGLTDANFDSVLTWAESLRDTWGTRVKLEFKWFEFWEARWKERMSDLALEAGRPKGA